MSYIAWMNSGKLSREEVGGKGSSLAELISAGFKVPDGFVVTADAYRHFTNATGIAGGRRPSPDESRGLCRCRRRGLAGCRPDA